MPLPLLIDKACEPPHASYGFCNASLPIAERVDDLIGRLTLEEKPYLLVARESPKGNISRLGLPEYDWGGNCIHGVQSRCAADDQGRVGYGVCATSFPDPNALGSTWNRSVWKNMASVIGVELRAMWRAGVGETGRRRRRDGGAGGAATARGEAGGYEPAGATAGEGEGT